jgi:AGZA family xanthine/uracil permease-like MFS transporter
MHTAAAGWKPKLFVAGDLDGFFALALDNLVNLLLISSFCLGLLGFSPALFYDHILPASAVSLVIGNLFYAREARALAIRENRADVCALPYGISLFTVFAYSLLVMLPAQQMALAAGHPKSEADLIAWRAGIAAALGTGLMEAVGGWWANQLRSLVPRAALLATPAMVGLLLISGLFFFKCVEFPLIGFTTLGLVITLYYGRMRLQGGVPASLLVIVVGTGLAWLFYRTGPNALVPVGTLAYDQIGFHFPVPVLGDLWSSLPYLYPFASIILPMGLLNLISSLQGLESAAAAGDHYPGRPALLINGLGTVGAAICGSPFPTTLYYGHPGWKALGARSAYSTLNAVFFTLILLTGTLSLITYAVPIEAGMAILVWIGATLFIQAFSTVPTKHYPALAMGMLPVVGGFTALVIRDALAGAGNDFSPGLLHRIEQTRNFGLSGVFAIDAGYIFMSVIWAMTTVYVVERRFKQAAFCVFFAAGVSLLGLMHSYQVTKFDVISAVQPAWEWAGSYVLMGFVFLLIPLLARPEDETAHND